MLSRIIQQQIPLGSEAIFYLKNGSEISGIVTEIGIEHVTLKKEEEFITILIDMVGLWRVLRSDTLKTDVPSPVPPQVPQPPDSTSTQSNQEVVRKLLEIEARFRAYQQVSLLQIKTPDFVLSDNDVRSNTNAVVVWDRVRNKYQYAEKINEISVKFGRIQPLIQELNSLLVQFPRSSMIKRHLAYFYYLQGNRQEALKLLKAAAMTSDHLWDWYNLAVLAIANQQQEIACYSLGRFFQIVPCVEVFHAWHFFVDLVGKFSDYQSIRAILDKRLGGSSERELVLLVETGIYLNIINNNKLFAEGIVKQWLDGVSLTDLVSDSFKTFQTLPNKEYQKLVGEFIDSEKLSNQREITTELQGFIESYSSKYGFLRDSSGKRYFFHMTAVSDDDLLEQLRSFSSGNRITVTFEPSNGPKGPIAIRVTLHRTIDEMYRRAVRYADDGEYHKAIAFVKKVLEIDPSYPSAQDSYEKWREYARVSGVPKGTNPYARAKRAQLVEKDPERAVQLLREAIKQKDNLESAVKDLAGLLAQLGRSEEAIQVLEKHRGVIANQQSVENILVGLYQSAGQYDKAIDLLKRKINQAISETKKAQLLGNLAMVYLKKGDYILAEQTFRRALKLQLDNRVIERNIAFCLIKQERFEEAKAMLERILSSTPDVKAGELLEAIKQAQAGQELSINVSEVVVETTLLGISQNISEFARFFLDHCNYQGVRADRIQSQNFNQDDIRNLEQLANRSRTIRPRERASYYLSAAKIASLLEEVDPNQFYKYLCRSFASSGDAIVIEGRHLDAAREFYSEALCVYDGDRSSNKDEQDAVNALVRFLFSTMGAIQVPINSSMQSIDKSLEHVLTHHPDRNKVFDAISYLVFRSRYAASRLFNRLYDKSSLQAMTLEYLKRLDIKVDMVKELDDFVKLWNEVVKRKSDEELVLRNEFRAFAHVELTTASLEHRISRVRTLQDKLFFELDRQRILFLQGLLEIALELCSQTAFEERERLCLQIDYRCQDALREIVEIPTRISIEHIYPLIQTIQSKIKLYLEDLYETSNPQLDLRLPVETYTPDIDKTIEVQIVVSNRSGCSPAEAVELIVQEAEATFSLRSEVSLRGGDQRILRLPIRLKSEIILAQAFSLPVYVRYRTRSGEIQYTPVKHFAIRLSSEQEFEEIGNPYTEYAEGGVVGDARMFYGRDDLIASVAKAIEISRLQSKCIVIYGQKRAGKSSILYHLKTRLTSNKDLLVIDIGNIGSKIDLHATVPLLHQFLWTILAGLESAIVEKVGDLNDGLNISFPTDIEFYQHPSPLTFFRDIFNRWRRAIATRNNWKNVRVVLLVDEFSYIYGYIASGLLAETFMRAWKALLQDNLFNVVLVGQDVMPKFKQRFPNEFGTTQDERVTYLRREDAIRLIDEPIRIGGYSGESRYRERAIERILELTAGSPFYIQMLCNRLVEYMNRKRASLVTEADVEQVKEELIRGVHALTIDKFDNLINSGDTSPDAISDEDALKVLGAIAEHSRTGPCSRSSIVCETTTPVDVILEDLVRRDVVECIRGQYYTIRVGLFKEWLLAHR